MKSRHDFPEVNTKDSAGIRPDGRPYKVMVVEDKDFHRRQIVQILESEQYNVVAQASNGEEALELYNQHSVVLDLITTDLDMPIMDGYALLFQLIEKDPNVKIVFISEDTSKGVIQDLIKIGAADFILKPIQRTMILKRIRNVVKTID